VKYLLLLICFGVPPFTQAQNSPKLIHFVPSSFSNSFTLNREPVLKIISGDTIHTQTIDAFGRDKNGIRRQRGGNPLTGPFYIENADPGDVLAVTFTDVSLDREYAYTSEAFVSRSLPRSITDQFKKVHLVKWRLDLQHGVGWPDSTFDTYENLKNFKVALHPFPGCIGVAPANRKNEVLSFFQGPFGGNLDYSSLTKGATVYLPVFHPGAYFYIGDGHATQGDGEIAGNALETSLDVTFTVRLIKSPIPQLTYPGAEDSVYIMSLGSAKKQEDALKIATAGLLDWLQKDFQLTLHEATQVMSTTIEYTIAEIADPEQIVVAKIKKQALKDLPRR
jgi:acetamidase/formamidase